jgi:hypothetical protein
MGRWEFLPSLASPRQKMTNELGDTLDYRAIRLLPKLDNFPPRLSPILVYPFESIGLRPQKDNELRSTPSNMYSNVVRENRITGSLRRFKVQEFIDKDPDRPLIAVSRQIHWRRFVA